MADLHVVIVEPEIHWNTGNLGRTCLAMGAQLHLVKPLGFSLSDAKVKRAGLDYWVHVKPQIWDSWEQFEAKMPDLGQPYFVTPDAPKTIWDVRYAKPAVILLGKETAGFTPDVRQKYREQSVSIPMTGEHVRSLNVSTCGGIVLSEVHRQWREAEI